MRKLLLATSNTHKTQEVRQILGDAWQVEDLTAHPGLRLAEETGDTFEANARIKAESASVALPHLLVLADDSGLAVDALKGDPGVRSARYAGEHATDADNRARLKTELGAVITAHPATPHSARFHCCMALARDGKTLVTRQGCVEGTLVLEEQGEGGFGYDPLFIPVGHLDTLGVLPAEVKNELSHRARALALMVDWLANHPECA